MQLLNDIPPEPKRPKKSRAVFVVPLILLLLTGLGFVFREPIAELLGKKRTGPVRWISAGEMDVRADFNGDGLEDIAIGETDADGSQSIAIYLRREAGDSPRAFIKAGHIQSPGEFAASAIMSSQADGQTNLVVILYFGDGRREMVTYRHSADGFRETSRDPL